MADALKEVLEDAIYYSLDAEQGAPHSGVDMAIVVDEFIKYLGHRGYEIVRAEHKTEPVDETIGPLDEYRGQ